MARKPGAARTLPLPSLQAALVQPPVLVSGMGRIDRSGRVADRAITQALNWQAGCGPLRAPGPRLPGPVIIVAARC
jgi:hypothetical protein